MCYSVLLLYVIYEALSQEESGWSRDGGYLLNFEFKIKAWTNYPDSESDFPLQFLNENSV